MIIGLTLTILLVMTLISVLLGAGFTASHVHSTIDNEAIVNGTTTSFEILNTDVILNIDPVIGAITIIIVIATVGAIVGIQVLASGLSPESVRVLIIAIAYTGIWTVLSFLALPLISSIEIFGSLIYVTLTIGYVIGVIEKVGGS